MRRGAVRLATATATLAAGGALVRALRGTPAALGATETAIRAAAERSGCYRDGTLHNPEPGSRPALSRQERRLLAWELIAGRAAGRPGAPIPVVAPQFPAAVPGALAVTWLGHATALIEVDGYRVLTDPVWAQRCSPSPAIGPKRLHPVPVTPDGLPAVDAIVISHDHYDHLDHDMVVALTHTQRAPFVVPLGVGAHLRHWGVPQPRVIELDWGEAARIGELTLTALPARHFSGRLIARNRTLWASFAIAGPTRRVYFGGDSGYTAGFADIGAAHGPFDLTLLPIGAYSRAWPDVHLDPEQAVRAHRDLNGDAAAPLLPIHWATFRLAPHPWAEPIERLLAAAGDIAVLTPRPGQRVDVAAPGATDRWWR